MKMEKITKQKTIEIFKENIGSDCYLLVASKKRIQKEFKTVQNFVEKGQELIRKYGILKKDLELKIYTNFIETNGSRLDLYNLNYNYIKEKNTLVLEEKQGDCYLIYLFEKKGE